MNLELKKLLKHDDMMLAGTGEAEDEISVSVIGIVDFSLGALAGRSTFTYA